MIDNGVCMDEENEQFLLDGTRFKLSFDSKGRVNALWNYADQLEGRWVALVPAENDCHLKARAALPASPAPSGEVEAVGVVAYGVPSARMTNEGWEDGPISLVFSDDASEHAKEIGYPLMTVAQHQRIVEHFVSEGIKLADQRDELRAQLAEIKEKYSALFADAPVRMEIVAQQAAVPVAYFNADWRRSMERDGLAPAWADPKVADEPVPIFTAPAAPQQGVVMPKTELWECQNTETGSVIHLPYKPVGPWDCTEYVRRSEIARLNADRSAQGEMP